MRATAVIPVKRFAAAKQRLLEAVDPGGRAAIVGAMLADVLAALCEAEHLERVIVVTAEKRAERIALAQAQRMRMPLEVLRDPDDEGHSRAATLGIVRAKALGAEAAALLPGDCPLLEAGELDRSLARMRPRCVAVIPDRHGTGTNGLLLCPADAIRPGFGEGSCERHLARARSAGHQAMREEVDSLALDLDTPADLEALVAALSATRERAPRTTAELVRLGLMEGTAG